jgi:dihydrofolate synthase/folylpolyglutamate synthase
MLTFDEAENLIFASYNRVGAHQRGYDQDTRDLAGMRTVYAQAPVPLNFAPAIIITGSKGKGSTSLLSATLLQSLGHRVGLFTSPHFRSVRERIRLNGQAIEEAAFRRIVSDLRPTIAAVDASLRGGKYLSPTGLFLACALRYFYEAQATALVLEVGRGGRFDDVRLYEAARVIAFTPIMGEHLDKLGPTVPDVAWHKGGLIRHGARAVTTPQSAEVMAVLDRIAAEQGVAMALAAPPVITQRTVDPQTQAVTQTITVNHLGRETPYTLHTPAIYQAENLALAAAAVSALAPALPGAPVQGSQAAVDLTDLTARLHLAGRCDLVSRSPWVYVDGAINAQSAAVFRQSVELLSPHPLVLVSALPHDKDHAGYFSELGPVADHIIVTHVSASHLNFDDQPVQVARRFNAAVTVQPDVFAAFDHAFHLAGVAGCIWIAGTQSLVRDALSYWKVDLESIFADPAGTAAHSPTGPGNAGAPPTAP